MTMRKTCCIFGAGEYGALTLTTEHLADCLIIAADGGYHWLKEHNITPHLAVGDFDSLGHVPEDVEVLKHPAEKDDTDMMLAVKLARRRAALPKGLWIASLSLVGAYLALLVVLVAVSLV